MPLFDVVGSIVRQWRDYSLAHPPTTLNRPFKLGSLCFLVRSLFITCNNNPSEFNISVTSGRHQVGILALKLKFTRIAARVGWPKITRCFLLTLSTIISTKSSTSIGYPFKNTVILSNPSGALCVWSPNLTRPTHETIGGRFSVRYKSSEITSSRHPSQEHNYEFARHQS